MWGSTNLALADLPEDTFPALRKMSLDELRLDHATTIWHVLPMVKDLTTVEMVFERHNPDSFPRLKTDTTNLCRLLSINSPNVTHLSLDFCLTTCDHGNFLLHKICKDVFTLLGELPLQELFMDGACCEDPSVCSLLATKFPQIRVLRLPYQSVQCRDLASFADNPNLEELSIQTKFGDIPDPEIVNVRRYLPQRVFRILRVDASARDYTKVQSFAM